MTNAIAGIGESMIAAASASLGNDWKAARSFAEPEFKRLATVLVRIADDTASGELSVAEAKALLEIHQNTTKMLMLTVEGLGLLAVENAVNAAFAVVRDAVNTAAGGLLL